MVHIVTTGLLGDKRKEKEIREGSELYFFLTKIIVSCSIPDEVIEFFY